MLNNNQEINSINGTVAGGGDCNNSSSRRLYREASQVVIQQNPHHFNNKKHINSNLEHQESERNRKTANSL